MWVSGDGSEWWCTRNIPISYLSRQLSYEMYTTTGRVNPSAQAHIRSQTHCLCHNTL